MANMNDSRLSLRRSPRNHAGSRSQGTVHPNRTIRQSSLVQCSSVVDQENVASGPQIASPSPSDIDRSAFLNYSAPPQDEFPAPPPSLLAVLAMNAGSDDDETPSSHIGSTQPLSNAAREEGEEEQIRDAAKSKELFVHLNRLTVKQQKSVATAFGVAHAGSKKVRAARIYLSLSRLMKRIGASAEEILEALSLEKGIDFIGDFRRTLDAWCDDHEETEVPSMSELKTLAGVRQHPRATAQNNPHSEAPNGSNGDRNNSTRANLTLDEFTRLMLIFRDVPEAAADLKRSCQDLSREQLDLHMNRNAFWHNRIEPLFNNPQIIFTDVFDGELHDVDPGRPVTTFRTGTCLQNMFSNFRKDFTRIYKNWTVSGDSKPSTFKNFCYIPETRVLSRAGLRCLIAFRVFEIGTPHENDLILDFGSNEMAQASNAGSESGLIQNTASEAGSKRRRSSSQELNVALINALNTFSSDTRSANDTKEHKKRREELDKLAILGAELDNNRLRIDSMVAAMRCARDLEASENWDPRILGIIKRYCARLANEMEDILGIQNNSGL